MAEQKPEAYILFDRRTRRYLGINGRWTRFAEDAVEYRTYAIAHGRGKALSEQEDRFIEVVRTTSHFRK